MRLIVLLGSGASLPAGMPCVSEITAQVLSGANTVRRGSDFFFHEDGVPPGHEMTSDPLEPVVAFVRDLRTLCVNYFAEREKGRVTNFEDIAYVARQIEHGTSEYENPVLQPLVDQLCSEGRGPRPQLERLAGLAADYIESVVRGMLARQIGRVDSLQPIVDAFSDPDVEQLDLFTLNHDRVTETALHEAGLGFSDGFERPHGSLPFGATVTDGPAAPVQAAWVDRTGIGTSLISTDGLGRSRLWIEGSDAEHPTGPDGQDLGPSLSGPEILTGTFNKILSYPTGIYTDQHFHFHEALATADCLLGGRWLQLS